MFLISNLFSFFASLAKLATLWVNLSILENFFRIQLILWFFRVQNNLSYLKFLNSYLTVGFSCVSNCGKYLDPSRRLHLSAECLDCVRDQPLTYSWSVMNGNASAPFAVWPERALTPLNSPEALILAGTFNNSSEYRIKVTVSRPNSGDCFHYTNNHQLII